MLTVREAQFMDRMPNLMVDLIDEIKKLRKEVAELRKELNEKNEK